jgi:hypothetical protein
MLADETYRDRWNPSAVERVSNLCVLNVAVRVAAQCWGACAAEGLQTSRKRWPSHCAGVSGFSSHLQAMVHAATARTGLCTRWDAITAGAHLRHASAQRVAEFLFEVSAHARAQAQAGTLSRYSFTVRPNPVALPHPDFLVGRHL